jgi:hypothetical protein
VADEPAPGPTSAPAALASTAEDAARAERSFLRRFRWLVFRALERIGGFADAGDLLSAAEELGKLSYRHLKAEEEDGPDVSRAAVERALEIATNDVRRALARVPAPTAPPPPPPPPAAGELEILTDDLPAEPAPPTADTPPMVRSGEE